MRKKRIFLSQKQRIEVQQKLKRGISIGKIMDFYGIGEKTVHNIKKQKIPMKQGINMKRKSIRPFKYIELDRQLFKWYQDRKTSGDTINYELLKKQAKKIKNNIGESPTAKSFYPWLYHFIKYHEIQLEFEVNAFHKEVDVALINWLLLQIISGDTISDIMLIDKTEELMKEFGGPLTSERKYKWLEKFKICHKILIKSDILQNFVERNDETNQSNKNLDDQLLNWLLERKKSGDTISLEMLADKTWKLIDEFDGPSKKREEKNWLWRIKKRYHLPDFRKMPEILQNVIQRDDEANHFNAEKFIQEFSQRLEKENIDKENIYNMIETADIWKRFVQTLLAHADKTKIAEKHIDIEKLKSNPLTIIFCTNVTGSNKLPPFSLEHKNEYENQTMSEHCESRLLVTHKLQENASTRESKDFAFWYKYLFKLHVKYHQEKKNVTGKVLLLVDNCMQRIFSENITQDKDFEILFLPTNAVSFFESLYPKLIAEIDKIFQDYVINLFEKKSFCEAKEFNRDYNIDYCITSICKPWKLIAPENIEKLWRIFLRQDRQIQEDTPTLTSASSQD
ncbi:tigger transposable element-derived protein 2-like [Formica exsecta]|uniref:tigger transposable element-derived protein 2-like n=1 Tax=Formica exsecta TaxID=72781 RepID=UPI001141FE2C|nr:tigger transposable element-derived protein 2-like [Formica exsecta]